jgi:ATP-dependent DNA helicase RecQ
MLNSRFTEQDFFYLIFAFIFLLTNIHFILQSNWGYASFRPMQEEIIQSVLSGKDTLAIMPTGGGKSICFQVPALATKGICLVITPLIALMKDQVESLKEKGIFALSIYSGMSFTDVKKTLDNALYGNYKFLYVSPERLTTSFFKEYLPTLPVNLIAVDEAHCISQWGYDFRPAYLTIADIRKEKPGVPVLALTASATQKVQNDICDKLQFSNTQLFRQSYERPNLSYSVINTDAKQHRLLQIVQKVAGCGIVYCRSRKRTKEMSELLRLHGISADFYHAGLTHEQRNDKQERWLKNETRIMVCTNAFGMGIDKPDVRLVVHTDIPDCLESYYQEAGRAGRDGKKSYAVLLYKKDDLNDLEKIPDTRFPSLEEIKKIYQALVNYLQLPAGAGEDVYFDFDITAFTKQFRLGLLVTTYAIKTLEQEGLLTYNEQIFLPSTVVFCCSKQTLEELEILFPAVEPYIKLLLRSYGGIFDVPVAISEKQMALILKKSVAHVKKVLKWLGEKRIIIYEPQKDTPQIQFLYNRVVTENLSINANNYNERKKTLREQVTAIMQYVNNRDDCHAQIIAQYFNDFAASACGICDNCLEKKKGNSLTKNDFSELNGKIILALSKAPLTVKELMQQLHVTDETNLWKLLDHLIAEKEIEMSEETKAGKVMIKKKGQDKNPARF